MNRLCLFAALNPQPGYPDTPMDLKIGNLRYDLFVPEPITKALTAHFVGSQGEYRLEGRYCDTRSIDEIRARPALMGDGYTADPVYAYAVQGVECAEDDDIATGYVALRLAVGPFAAWKLFLRAGAGTDIDSGLAKFIVDRDEYFRECGGFELMRIAYYANAKERVEVVRSVDGDEQGSLLELRRQAAHVAATPGLTSPIGPCHSQKIRFRDFN